MFLDVDVSDAFSSLSARPLHALQVQRSTQVVQGELLAALIRDVQEQGTLPSARSAIAWAARIVDYREQIDISAFAAQVRAGWTNVVRLCSGGARYFLKTTLLPKFKEAELGQALERMGVPVARTVAYEPEQRWWLTESVPGRSLAVNGTCEALDAVAASLASWQSKLSAVTGSYCTPSPPLTAARLKQGVSAVFEHAAMSVARSVAERACRDLHLLIDHVDFDQTQFAVLHTDPAPSNIMIADSGGVALIDWAEATIGPKGLAIEFYIECLRRFRPSWLQASGIDADRLRSIYRANGGVLLALDSESERTAFVALCRAVLNFEYATVCHEYKELDSAFAVECHNMGQLLLQAHTRLTSLA